MSKSTILVTGSAGYVGGHTALRLKDLGYRVVGVDNFSTSYRRYAELVDEMVEADITDRPAMRKLFSQRAIGAVVHCAALALVPESVEVPERYYAVNVGGTASLLEAMREAGVRRFVLSSTAATYGQPDGIITEETPQRPINPYGASKLAVEELLWSARDAWGLEPAVFRYFNVAGADPAGRFGEDREVETHLIPNILRRAAAGKGFDGFEVFGDDYDTPDGTCVRDYVHVMDLAEAHALGVSADVEALGARLGALPSTGLGAGGSTRLAFCLGSGGGYSVREVVQAAMNTSGVHFDVAVGPRRAGDPASLVTSIERARDLMGWEPELSSLDTILETAWAWHQKVHGGKAD